MFQYISVSQVIDLHDKLIKDFGGLLGLRSYSLLDSAVMRMRATFDGFDLYPTIYEKAAALFQSLCKNHPFVDGNKRTAYVATKIFLAINGIGLFLNKDIAERFVLRVARDEAGFQEIIEFFENHAK